MEKNMKKIYVYVFFCPQLSPTLTPWTVAHQAPLSMEFFRQEYQSRLPFPTPGNLPDPGLNAHLLHLLN